ncbi:MULTISPECIES: hypothetical protein [Nocardia]|uniref:hypothetical protein n=1 Tax=Nocardia farcinica TaxID=37329 RepID=UPI00187D4BFC|nr:hypothetical protein [Nocardia farcinica]
MTTEPTTAEATAAEPGTAVTRDTTLSPLLAAEGLEKAYRRTSADTQPTAASGSDRHEPNHHHLPAATTPGSGEPRTIAGITTATRQIAAEKRRVHTEEDFENH